MSYTPSCPTSTPGSVGIALQYDIQDTLPANITTLSQIDGSRVAPVWGGSDGVGTMDTNRLGANEVGTIVDCRTFDKPWFKFITAADLAALALPVGTNFVPVSLVVGTVGGPAVAVTAGFIWVHYQVDLIEPIPPTLNA